MSRLDTIPTIPRLSGPDEPPRGSEPSILEILGDQVAYWVVDRSTSESHGSSRLHQILGPNVSLCDPADFLDLAHPEDRDRLTDVIAEGVATAIEFRIKNRDGRYQALRGRVQVGQSPALLILILEESADNHWAVGELVKARRELEARLIELGNANENLHHEIAGRERTERALLDSRTLYLSLVDSIPYAIFRKDLIGRYTFGNRRYCDMHKLTVEGLIGKTDYELYPVELARKYRDDDRKMIESGEVLDFEEEHLDPSGSGRRQVVHTIKTPIYDATGRPIGIQGMFADVTERQLVSEVLVYQSTHDSLTGLPNRVLFQERLETHLAEVSSSSSQLAVLVVDLDRFKEVNETLGHHYGDRILQRLTPRFQAALKPGDTVARIGGDEFGLIINDTNLDQAEEIARNLVRSLAEPVFVYGHRFDIDASIGVALSPDHGTCQITLLQRADVAMYAAKRSQSGHAIYAAEQLPYRPEKLSFLAELRHALGADQFLLHYQPKLDLATRSTRSAEALIRWQHPREGLVSPGQFIPLAEQTGLIRAIDLWVANAALEACRSWPSDFGPATVAVNLAAPGLQDPTLVDQFARMFDRIQIEPSRLVVEVTESAMMADPIRARGVLEKLHTMGVAIAIDDFGTGYSSFAYLKDLPIDEVKIDQSFVRDMAGKANNAWIVRAIVDLGHNLGLRVTAEGVEDAETLKILGELGCDYAQGYHISPPLPAADFECWLRSQPTLA